LPIPAFAPVNRMTLPLRPGMAVTGLYALGSIPVDVMSEIEADILMVYSRMNWRKCDLTNTEKVRNAGGNLYVFLFCYQAFRLLLAGDQYRNWRSRRRASFPDMSLRRPACVDEATGTRLLYYPEIPIKRCHPMTRHEDTPLGRFLSSLSMIQPIVHLLAHFYPTSPFSTATLMGFCDVYG
jgi:hypothetical protein